MVAYVLIIAVVCGFAGGMILEPRSQFGAGFALGLFLGPLGLVIATVMRANTPAVAQPGERTCPDCAEIVKAAAIKCRYCGATLAPVRAPAQAQPLRPYVESKNDGATTLGYVLVGIFVVIVGVVMFIQGRGDGAAYTQPIGTVDPSLGTSPAHPLYDTAHIVAPAGHAVASGFYPAPALPHRERASSTPAPRAREAASANTDSLRALAARAAAAYPTDTVGAVPYGAADSKPVIVSGDARNGQINAAGRPEAAGIIRVQFVVEADGRVTGAIGESDNGELARLTAIAAVLSRTYTAGMKNGQPVAVRVTQIITIY